MVMTYPCRGSIALELPPWIFNLEIKIFIQRFTFIQMRFIFLCFLMLRLFWVQWPEIQSALPWSDMPSRELTYAYYVWSIC